MVKLTGDHMWLDGLTMVANLELLCRPWCVWAAGLEGTAPTNTLKTGSADGCRIKDLKRLDVNLTSSLKDSKGRKLSHLAWLFDEPTVYKMLLRGHDSWLTA